MAELIAQQTGQTVEQIEKDADRDRWFTAEQAKDYGFVDEVSSACRRSRSVGHGRRRNHEQASQETP